jgi:hypothetical protein
MIETSGQIEAQILHTRDELGANLSELERKVKSATDWRRQYRKSPVTFIAVAAGAGLAIGLLSNRRNDHGYAPGRAQPSGIKTALLGMVVSHGVNAVLKLVPHFERQGTQRVRQRRPEDPMRPMDSTLTH